MHDILYNLKTAREYLMLAPVKSIDLGYFKQEDDCGTLMCAAGWLTQHPHFAQFMKLVPHTRKGWLLGSVQNEVESVDHYGWLDKHFGTNAYGNCFKGRDCGDRDDEHPRFVHQEVSRSVSDKALALWRLDQQIEAETRKIREAQ